MKRIFALVLALVVCGVALAGEREVQNWEGGISVGIGRPVGGYQGGHGAWGPSHFGLNVRYNLDDMPLDFGAYLMIDMATYDMPDGNRHTNYAAPLCGVEGNYNLWRGTKFSPYAGLGVGFLFIDRDRGREDDIIGPMFSCSPHVGVELLYHIRLEAGLEFSKRGHHVFELSLQLVLGGRPRKK